MIKIFPAKIVGMEKYMLSFASMYNLIALLMALYWL